MPCLIGKKRDIPIVRSLGLWFRTIIESLFTVVFHARSALDFAAHFFDSILLIHLIGMPDYNSNEIVDILLVLGECRDNYRRAAALYH